MDKHLAGEPKCSEIQGVKGPIMTAGTRHVVAEPSFLKALPRKLERPIFNQFSAQSDLGRKLIKVLRRVPDAAPRLAERPQLTEEISQLKRRKASGATGAASSMKSNGKGRSKFSANRRMLGLQATPDFLDSALVWRRMLADIWGTFLLVLVAAGGGVVREGNE